MAAKVDWPTPPKAPKLDVARPAQAGDKVLHQDDIVSSTNYMGPYIKAQPGLERGLTRREDRALFGARRGGERRQAEREMASGQPEHRRRLSTGRTPARSR